MNEMGLHSVRSSSKKDFYKKKSLDKNQNILNQEFSVSSPNSVWVNDIACFKLKDKYQYICVVIDIFSSKVISHKISYKNTQLIRSTFKTAYEKRKLGGNLLFHSDQGSQYTSYAFRMLLKKHDVIQSFSNPGRPYNNSVAESFFSSLKQEEFYRYNYRSETHLIQIVTEYMEFYNENDRTKH